VKIYIHTDLEGVTDVLGGDQVPTDSPDYRRSRENLMADLNAAVAGAFDGGADEVTVLDSHGGKGENFLLDMLDERAVNDTKPNGKWWGILDDSYDGTMFLGAHAMAGTINAFLDHTQSGLSWYNYYLNGRRFGELGQWATVAGHFGVPMLMVCGDEAACAEARAFFRPVETAAVKQGLQRTRAMGYPPEEARARIRQAAKRAIALVGTARPFRPIFPAEVKLETTRSDFADELAQRWPEAERLDARTLRRVAADGLDILF